MDFNLSTYFNAFDVDKDYSADISNVDNRLESVTNSLANNPESINYNADLLEDLIDLTHVYRTLESKQQKQLAYLITSSFNTVGHQFHGIVESGDFVDSIETIKSTLERYAYLIFVLTKYLGKEEHSQIGGRAKNATNTQASINWKSNCVQIEDCLISVVTVLQIDLSKIFVTTPERDLFIELFTRPNNILFATRLSSSSFCLDAKFLISLDNSDLGIFAALVPFLFLDVKFGTPLRR